MVQQWGRVQLVHVLLHLFREVFAGKLPPIELVDWAWLDPIQGGELVGVFCIHSLYVVGTTETYDWI